MAYISGKSGFVSTDVLGAGGAPYFSFNKWSASIKAILPEVTNFTTAGYQTLVSGIVSADLTLTAPINQGLLNPAFTQDGEPVGGPPGIGAGSSGTGFAVGSYYTFNLGFTSTLFLVVSALVTGLDVDEDVEGNPILNITAESDGSFAARVR